jgi:acetyl esterase
MATTSEGLLDTNRELLESAQAVVYKVSDGIELRLYVFRPEAEQSPSPSHGGAPEPAPAGVFFFSSLWDRGRVGQFAPHCLYYASRGMVTIAAEYRVASVHGTGPLEAIVDVRSVMRWIRANAEKLHIDPQKVVAFGGSGGAHAAVAAAMFDGFDEPEESELISPTPDALVLFSPVLDLSKKGVGSDFFDNPKIAKAVSPVANVRKGLPPTLVFHGTGDRVVPFRGSADFTRRMRRKKNVCQLIEFEGQGHSFFNFNVDMGIYEMTLNEVDRFLAEVGVLPEPAEGELLG